MKCNGTSSPLLGSLRRPVSIGCPISTRTSATSPSSFTRIRIGSAIGSRSNSLRTAAADRHLDLSNRHEVLAARAYHHTQVGGLSHLDASGNERFGAVLEIEAADKGLRVLVHEHE